MDIINVIYIGRTTTSIDYDDLLSTLRSLQDLNLSLGTTIVLKDVFRSKHPDSIKNVMDGIISQTSVRFYEIRRENCEENVYERNCRDWKKVTESVQFVGRILFLRAGQTIKKESLKQIAINIYQDSLKNIVNTKRGKDAITTHRQYSSLFSSPRDEWNEPSRTRRHRPCCCDTRFFWEDLFRTLLDIYYFCRWSFLHFWFFFSNLFCWLAGASTFFFRSTKEELNLIKVPYVVSENPSKNVQSDGSDSRQQNNSLKEIILFSGQLPGASTIISERELLSIGGRVSIVRTLWTSFIILAIAQRIMFSTGLTYYYYMDVSSFTNSWVAYFLGVLWIIFIQRRKIRLPPSFSCLVIYSIFCMTYHFLLPIFVLLLLVKRFVFTVANLDETWQFAE